MTAEPTNRDRPSLIAEGAGAVPMGGKRRLHALFGAQSFWVTIVLVAICAVMSYREPDSFATEDNFFNITRNFAFIGVMALGMTPVIITGGIDLSVGSVMGLVAIVCGLVLLKQPIPFMPDWWNEATWTHSWWMALTAGLLAGALTGAINGVLIAYVGLPPFVVTLSMLSIARAVAVVLSGNRMLYDFGPGAPAFKVIGGGQNFALDFLPVRLSNPRAGSQLDRRAGQPGEGAGLCPVLAVGGACGHSERRLVGLGQ